MTPVGRLAVTAVAGLAFAGAAFRAAPAGPPSDAEGLARQVCSSCHLFPPPESLPRRAWGSIAYEMAGLIMTRVGAPRGGPALSADFDVDKVISYYESRAPRVLASPDAWPEPGRDPERFARHPFRAPPGGLGTPAVANVRFQSITPGGPLEVVAADMGGGLVMAVDPNAAGDTLRLLGRVPNPCHTERVDLDKDGRMDLIVANLGSVPPEDHTKGSVVWMQALANGTYRVVTLASGLPRVADVQAVDVDGDGDLDLIVAAFGWRTSGGVFLLENRTVDYRTPVFVKREIDGRCGAIHVPVADLNGDGFPDFVALFAQHHEAVVAFLNDGKGSFRAETIDQAPHPAWGSSGIELVDLDGDGDQDVLVTNGDMLDDFQVKPYHGIRWLENRGKFPFVPHDIANLPGAHRARAVDLDGDGDLDIVACAFVEFKAEGTPASAVALYPSLVWLEQTSPGTFVRHTLERGGRHVTLDVGDYDHDGDMDIVVGNFRTGGGPAVEIWENLKVKR
jgi:FG-GAP-like repeat